MGWGDASDSYDSWLEQTQISSKPFPWLKDIGALALVRKAFHDAIYKAASIAVGKFGKWQKVARIRV